MKKLILLLSILCIQRVYCQTWVQIPDPNFVTYLQGLIPAAMNGSSLDITNMMVTTNIQTINIQSQSITNLYGVQYFSSLKYLNCSINPSIAIPALPSSLISLACIYCSLNSLPSLPNSLQTLACGGNQLTSLPALPASLTKLSCFQNLIANLPVLSNSLLWLDCSYNSWTILPALPNSLTYLNCSYSNVTTLPTLPNSLLELHCDHNSITCFPVFPNSLQFIDITYNTNSCLPNFVLPAMNIYTNTPLCARGNTNGCIVAGIKELNSSKTDFSVYPNPSKGQFTIISDGSKQNVQIFNATGSLIHCASIENEKTEINLSGQEAGIYFIKVGNYTSRLIRE